MKNKLKNGSRYQTPNEFVNTLETMNIKTVKSIKKIEYFNIAVSFDIETSSFIDKGEKTAIMYIWMMDFCGNVIIGRTWQEFIDMCEGISEKLALSENRRLIVYVHNLSYEFQFFCHYFKWLKVFAIETRKPVYALTDIGIEFRCSYILSGYSLEKLGNTLINHSVKKLVGNLDYKLIRHSETELTDDELDYCINDVKVVTAYIEERIANDGDITKIPLTKTGYVRRYCKKATIGRGVKTAKIYKDVISLMTIDSDEYTQLKKGFQGGFTHANPFYSGKIIDNVASFDFTSSYPAVMLSEKFPMSASKIVDVKSSDEFYSLLKTRCCLFDAKFTNLEPKVYFDNYISSSKVWGEEGISLNNGRVIRANVLITTLTEIDFRIIEEMYTWETLEIANFRIYQKAYLPTTFIKAIIKLDQDKTKLKGVDGSEYEYAKSKEMINSAYGMTVTDICRDEINFIDDWTIERGDMSKSLDKYNNSKARFLFYPWGVWVTAYARKNLFTGILECGNDYVYSDTDSLKICNYENHLDYIDEYNDRILEKLSAAMQFHGLDLEEVTPKTIDGKIKPLGVWDFEGVYTRFKTLGAKRYLVEKDGELELTVSGLRKKDAIEYLKANYDDVFAAFNDEMEIPKGHTGKMIHTYIDEDRKGVIKDYKGKSAPYYERSCIHLDDAEYSLKIGKEYARLLLQISSWEM